MSVISKLNTPGVLPHSGQPPKYSDQILQADQKATNENKPQEPEQPQEIIVLLHSQEDDKSMQSKAAEEKLQKLEQDVKRLKDLQPSSGLNAEEMVAITKKKLLSSMINSARMLLSSKYTAKSWTKMVDAMKSVLPVANTQNPKASDLDKAIGVLLLGLSALEYTDPAVQDKGVREDLPNDLNYRQSDPASSLTAAGALVNRPADSAPAVNVATAANGINISI